LRFFLFDKEKKARKKEKLKKGYGFITKSIHPS